MRWPWQKKKPEIPPIAKLRELIRQFEKEEEETEEPSNPPQIVVVTKNISNLVLAAVCVGCVLVGITIGVGLFGKHSATPEKTAPVSVVSNRPPSATPRVVAKKPSAESVVVRPPVPDAPAAPSAMSAKRPSISADSLLKRAQRL